MDNDIQNNIVIFASGAGSNAKQIINYFKNDKKNNVVLIVSNNPNAGVLNIASDYQIPTLIIEKEKFKQTGYLAEIKKCEPALIVLAGFLWMIPKILIEHFPHKIINIHPALLPSYGGKGMYGNAVHEAVINSKEKESGITIHYVDDKYDHGQTILQAKYKLTENESAESLANEIHKLEHEYYAPTINELLNKKNKQAIVTK